MVYIVIFTIYIYDYYGYLVLSHNYRMIHTHDQWVLKHTNGEIKSVYTYVSQMWKIMELSRGYILSYRGMGMISKNKKQNAHNRSQYIQRDINQLYLFQWGYRYFLWAMHVGHTINQVIISHIHNGDLLYIYLGKL